MASSRDSIQASFAGGTSFRCAVLVRTAAPRRQPVYATSEGFEHGMMSLAAGDSSTVLGSSERQGPDVMLTNTPGALTTEKFMDDAAVAWQRPEGGGVVDASHTSSVEGYPQGPDGLATLPEPKDVSRGMVPPAS